MLSNAAGKEFDSGRARRLRVRARDSLDRALRALRAALPQACFLCCAASGEALLCAHCAARMPRIASACPRCALPSFDGAVCGRCLARPPRYTFALAAWRYEFPASRLLHAFKYGGTLALAEPFAIALAEAAVGRAASLPDRLVALPLGARRQRERGFNHAQEIARRLSALLDVPLADALRRTRDTPPQAGLTLRERARNVRGAFVASGVRGRSVAIVDDVMTTGATLDAAAAAALAAGAVRVEAWVVARTLPPAQSERRDE